MDGKPNVNNTISTVGFNNLNKTVQISDGSLINCCLLDTAGQERFEAINTQYYRRADAVGTPFCVTIDDETINNNTVTVRDRDTMEQITISVDELVNYIKEKTRF